MFLTHPYEEGVIFIVKGNIIRKIIHK